MSTDKRISFRITDDELIQKLEEKLARTKIAASTYLRELVERDLEGRTINELRSAEYPIKDLTQEILFPSDLEEYQSAVAYEDPELPRREHDLLPNLIRWTYKIIHTPDRTDMALMTIGELYEAMESTWILAKEEPALKLRDVYDMAARRIDAAKKRRHLKSVDHVPTEEIHGDPEIPSLKIADSKQKPYGKKPNDDVPKAE